LNSAKFINPQSVERDRGKCQKAEKSDESVSGFWVLAGIKHCIWVSSSSSETELEASGLYRQAEEPDSYQDNGYLIKLKVGDSTCARI
jgi:hypothetical protein